MSYRLFAALPAALLLLAAPAASVAQGYGPAVVDTFHYEMYRGDMLDIAIGQDADWAEVKGEAVAAILSEGNKLRLVAVKPGEADVAVSNHDKLVWRAEVVVR